MASGFSHGNKLHPAIVDQSPERRAFVTKPEVFETPASAIAWFRRAARPARLNQEQLPLVQLEERLGAARVNAVAEHRTSPDSCMQLRCHSASHRACGASNPATFIKP